MVFKYVHLMLFLVFMVALPPSSYAIQCKDLLVIKYDQSSNTQIFSKFKINWPKKHNWTREDRSRPGRVYLDHYTEEQAQASRQVIEEAMKAYYEFGPRAGYLSLIGSSSQKNSDVEVIYVDVDIPYNGLSLNYSIKKMKQQSVEHRYHFNQIKHIIKIPRARVVSVISGKEINPKALRLGAQKNILDGIFLKLFQVALEEWIHFAQFSHGRTLSTVNPQLLTGVLHTTQEPGGSAGMNDYVLVEQDIPFLFHEWGIPFDRDLLENHVDVSRAYRFHSYYPDHHTRD